MNISATIDQDQESLNNLARLLTGSPETQNLHNLARMNGDHLCSIKRRWRLLEPKDERHHLDGPVSLTECLGKQRTSLFYFLNELSLLYQSAENDYT